MPNLTPTIPAAARGVQQIAAPEEQEFDIQPMLRRQDLARVNQLSLDLAVESNRRNTPQAAIEKRAAPRYSIAELNEMDMEALRDRFEKLPPLDERPGIMRVLDVIDLPRNLVANALTSIFMPEARQRVIERGEFGAFGLPRVMGSDVLKSMGIENRVVNAIAGFGIDILTDPLSYIGAPIGGLAVRAGKGSTAVFGRTGQKALMGGLKQVEKGGIGSIQDATVRELFQTTAARHGLTDLSGAELRSELAGRLIGKRGGGVRKTADIVLGTAGSGGDLATLISRTVNNTDDALEAAQIGAVKKFAEQFTLNKGIRLGGANAGSALAHIPFTDVTMYTPAWTKSGKQAVLQRSIALAREGNAEASEAFLNLQTFADDIDRQFNEMDQLLRERDAIRDADMSGKPLEYEQDFLVSEGDVLSTKLGRDMQRDIRLATKKGAAEVEAEDAASRARLASETEDEFNAAADATAENAARRESIDYRSTNKANDLTGIAVNDTGQAGLLAVAMLAKHDDALKGRRLAAINPATVKIGDEFDIGEATVKVVDDYGDAVEVDVVYPPQMMQEADIPLGGGEMIPGGQRVTREGFETTFVIPKAEGNYIPANKDTLKRKIIRHPEDAYTINSRRIRNRRERIATTQDMMKAQLSALAESRVFEETTELGDLLAMMEKVKELTKKTELLSQQGRWMDALEEIGYARKVRGVATRSAALSAIRAADGTIPEQFIDDAGEVLVDDIVTALDNMAPDDARVDAYRTLKTQFEAQQSDRVRRWLEMTDDDIDAAVQVAEAFNDTMAAAQDVANQANRGVRQYLDSDAVQLRATAAKILGMGDDVVGRALIDRVAFPFSKAMNMYGNPNVDDASRLASLGLHPGLVGMNVQRRAGDTVESVNRGLGVGFMGTGNGLVDAARAKAQQTVRMASRTEGRAIQDMMANGGGPFSKGTRQIANDFNIDADDIPKLETLVTAIVASREGNRGTFWATLPNGDPSDAAVFIQEAMESGILQNRPELLRELTTMADEWVDELRRLGDGAVENGTLKVVHNNYIPTAMTEPYARAAGQARNAGLRENMGFQVGEAGTMVEPFQKAKGTWEIRYQAADGEVRSFLLSTARLYKAVGDDPTLLAGRHPAAQDAIEEVKSIVDEFESLHGSIDDPAIVNAFGRALDPFTLNRLAKEDGVFLDLTGYYGGDMFQTSASDLLAGAVRQHAVADAKKALADYIGQFGINLAKIQPATKSGAMLDIGPNGLLQSEVVGGKFHTADGTKAYVIDRRRMRIGDRTYKTIDTEKLNNLAINPFESMVERGQVRYFFPEAVADTIERFAEQLQPEQVRDILKFTDTLTRVWRASTLAHPSWTITNMLGNMFIGAIEFRDRLPAFTANVKKAVQVLLAQGDPQKLADLNITLGGQTMPASEVLRITETGAVTSAGRSAETTEHVLREGFQAGEVRNPIAEGLTGVPRRAGRRLKEKYAQALEEQAINESMRLNSLGGPQVKPGDVNKTAKMKLMASAAALKDAPFRDLMKAWFRFNGSIDDAFRMGAMFQYLDDGYDVTEAVAKTKRSFFNFSDMTQFENRTLRALMPFYAWLRGSMPAMLLNLRDDPMYFSIMPKGFEAIEELLAGEEQVPRHRRPRWINETLGVQIGADPETRKVLLAGTLLPQEQALQVLSGGAGLAGTFAPGDQGFGARELMEFLDFGLGQMGPAVKVPLELGLGRETFSGRTIGPSSTEGDISINEYALGQVRWLRETGVGSVRDGALQRSFEEGIGSGIGRLTIGGRLQPGLQEDRRQYGIRRDMSEREEQIRRAFNLAQREGDRDAMLRARDELMSLYRDFLRSGGAPGDIPKWAREDLMELGVELGAGTEGPTP